jgi:hypothetical protein
MGSCPMQNEPIEVTIQVTQVLEKLNILSYLRKWANDLKVDDLLERALKEME